MPSATNCLICSISCYSVFRIRSSAAISTALAMLANCSVVDCRRYCPVTINNNWFRSQRIKHLDLIVVPKKAVDFVSDVTVHSLLFSDHSLVRCRIGVPPQRPHTVSYTSRDIRRIDLESFRRAINTSLLYDEDALNSLSTDAYTELFESEVKRVLDVCAPLRTKTRRQVARPRSTVRRSAHRQANMPSVGETISSIRIIFGQTTVPRS